MEYWKSIAVLFGILCSFQLGLLIAPLARHDARADEPVPGGGHSTEAAGGRPEVGAGLLPGGSRDLAGQRAGDLWCHVFRSELAYDDNLRTGDRTTEVGQWVGNRRDEGWVLHGVDFETAQKSTGYPTSYVQVCMVAP